MTNARIRTPNSAKWPKFDQSWPEPAEQNARKLLAEVLPAGRGAWQNLERCWDNARGGGCLSGGRRIRPNLAKFRQMFDKFGLDRTNFGRIWPTMGNFMTRLANFGSNWRPAPNSHSKNTSAIIARAFSRGPPQGAKTFFSMLNMFQGDEIEEGWCVPRRRKLNCVVGPKTVDRGVGAGGVAQSQEGGSLGHFFRNWRSNPVTRLPPTWRFPKTHDVCPALLLLGLSAGFQDFCHLFVAQVPTENMSDKSRKQHVF